MSEKAVELIVVGAGISGLGFAHLARRQGIETLVLEASPTPGGCIRSHRFENPEGPYWIELGAHTCYNSYGNLLQMLEDTDQLEALQPKQKLRYRIQTAEGLKSIPSQLNLFELLGVVPRLLMSKKAGRSARDYFGGILGRRNFQRVLGPALDAVVCQPAGEFPADALFRKKPRRKEIMRSYTGQLGLQSFVEAIVDQPGLEILTGRRVESIERTAAGYRLNLAGGDPLEAQRVALAVAPDVAASLLQGVSPQVTELISQVDMAEIESLAVLLRKEAVGLPPVAGIIGRDDDFYSVLSRDPVPDSSYRAFTFHFRPGRLDEAGKLARIRQVLGVEASDIEATAACVNRLPALRLGHAERIERLDQTLAGEALAMTGNWFAGVSIEDSLIRTAEEFARLFPSA
jgi:protoporphyrinogen oxidase